MAVKDFRTNDIGDIFADVTGDIATTESDGQHVADLCHESPGSFKLFPLMGAGLPRNINSQIRDNEMISKIRVNLTSDNYKIYVLKFDKNNELDTEVERIEKV